MQRNSWEKQYPALKKILLMTYNAEKKSYTVMWGEKLPTPAVWEKIIISKSPIPPSSTYVQWHVSHLGGGGRNGFDYMHVIKWWFSRLKFCISKIENTPKKYTNGKRKFSGMLSFLFVDKRKLFAMKLSLEEINLVSTQRMERLACFEPTKVARILKNLEVHSVLYGQGTKRF